MGCTEEPSPSEDPGCEVRSPRCVPGTQVETEQTRGQNETAAISRGRVFTTEAKTEFHHPNADKRPKGIISQSVVWEGNKGYKLERALCTNNCSYCWVRPHSLCLVTCTEMYKRETHSHVF